MHSEPSQTSKTELKAIKHFHKSSTLDAWLGSEYTSAGFTFSFSDSFSIILYFCLYFQEPLIAKSNETYYVT